MVATRERQDAPDGGVTRWSVGRIATVDVAVPVPPEERELAGCTEARRSSLPVQSEPTSTLGNDLVVLVGAAVDGDLGAVEGVLRWIRPLVVRYCRARVGSQEKTVASADDIVQEVCFAVLKALPGYRDQGRPFLAFVYSIAAHKVADARRSAARNRAEPVPEIPDIPELADGPEQRAMQNESAGRMTKLLDTLSGKQREILVLRVVMGLSTEETAKAVNSTPGAVRVAQNRALNRLRSVLALQEIALTDGTPSAGRLDRTGGRCH
ncbi:MAG: RNA polymerase sigma factor ShbA [Pseudonocardiales bacterium]|nr:RNA polymerase sigma factor ShbA [Pseudonocardiales bacterium]